MDHDRFDDLTKALASGVSRREALRKIGGGLLGAALASLLPGRTQAAPGGGGGPKPGRCGLPGQPCKFNRQCCPGSVCLDGSCTPSCPTGQTACSCLPSNATCDSFSAPCCSGACHDLFFCL